MKAILCAIVFLALSSVGQSEISEEEKEQLLGDIAKCKEETKVNDEDLEIIKAKAVPTSKEGQCMIACMMKKMDLLKEDATLNLVAIKAQIQENFKEDQDKVKKLCEISEECVKEVEASKDPCETAAKFSECSSKKIMEAGIPTD